MLMDTDLQHELDQLRAENARLKGTSKVLTFKVASKGGLSVYGLNSRFPVTLYKEQWLKLLDAADKIREFIAANETSLKTKD